MSEYSTQAIHITSILKAVGFQWSEVRLKGNRVTFIFEQTPQLESTLNKITLGEIQVEPFKLLEAQRVVKKLIRDWRPPVSGRREVGHGER